MDSTADLIEYEVELTPNQTGRIKDGTLVTKVGTGRTWKWIGQEGMSWPRGYWKQVYS